MTTRREMLIAFGGVFAAPIASLAQQPSKVWRIGFLAARSRPTSSNPDVHYDAFTQGMRELGYVEGKNLIIEWRFADGKYERYSGLAAELVQMKVQVIVTHGTTGTQAAQVATRTIPIVTAAAIDPVSSGFASSLARPGGNITGVSVINVDLVPKHLELLKTTLPRLSRVAVLVNPGNPAHLAVLKSAQAAAQQFGMKILPFDAPTSEGIERSFAMMKRERAEAVIVAADTFFIGQGRQIAELALKDRMPTMTPVREHVLAGCLMSYGPNTSDNFRRAAYFVDKVLKGAKPGELPFEQPTKIELVINLKTAKTIGLTIPRDLLFRADNVME